MISFDRIKEQFAKEFTCFFGAFEFYFQERLLQGVFHLPKQRPLREDGKGKPV